MTLLEEMMAAGRLPEPGSKVGPCNVACKHFDCHETRTMAAHVCSLCGQPIGYGVRFYRVDRYLKHAVCLENQMEQQK